jgi:Enhancer of rudimentary
MSHTIILVQYTNDYATRSYLEFPTVAQAMDALVKMYEHKLKELNPDVRHITYDISDLFNFLDSLQELVGLVMNGTSYLPKDKTWVKESITSHLKGQAIRK